ncbi:MAG TPA: serine/threonine-protein kinase, partial [Gaiellaceae bacterium]|nr:serine/threonine-protein kinase [Gaiellaceae bacterium]
MHGPNDTVVADFDPSCVEPDEPHLLAGRYRLEGLLGRGGMGSVYAAHDIELDERVAVKLLAADTSDETAAVRLRAEVRIARKVTHPNVARTYDVGIHDGRRFLTMELVDGPSLRGLVHTRTLTWRERLSIVEQVASGLAAIHACGVLHRDLKPENVLVSSAGTAKITDFGIALTADSGPRSTAGTPRYMAPELLVGGQPTFASDVYALGLVAYDVLAERTAPGRGVDPLALSPDARPVVERCLLDDPTRRPTALDVVQAVGALRSEPAPATIAVPRQARTPMRVGVSAFVADAGGDAYLGTSLAADVLRVLVVAPELEVAAFILPSTDPVREARRARLGAVVCGSVRR